jgi:AAA domain
MALADLISSGPIKRARRIGIHGPPAVGKSTLASQFPRPLFLDLEDGTSELNVTRIGISSFEGFETTCRTLFNDHQGIETLVVDPIDALEKLLRIQLNKKYKKSGIEEFSYGKGWIFLAEEFEQALGLLDVLITKNINVVIIGHTAVRRVYLPELTDPFDRYELQLYDRNAARLKQWLDALLFVNWRVRVQESSSGRMRGLGGKERAIFTTYSAAFDAKNRVDLPERLPCEFAALAPLFANAPTSPTAKPITRPTVDPVIVLPTPSTDGPELEAAGELSVQEQLKQALFGIHEDWVTEFLINRQKIAIGQSILDAPADYCESALRRITKFRSAIVKFGHETNHVPVDENC